MFFFNLKVLKKKKYFARRKCFSLTFPILGGESLEKVIRKSFMRKSWEGYEKVLRKSWESHKKVTIKSQEGYKKVMRNSWDSHKNLMRNLWESHEKVIRKSWKSHAKVMRKPCSQLVADISVLVCSVRGDPITSWMVGHKTMASLSGKGDVKKWQIVSGRWHMVSGRCQMVMGRCHPEVLFHWLL